MSEKFKVIQITSTGIQLFALCDDGSIWYRNPGDSIPEWYRIPNIDDKEMVEHCSIVIARIADVYDLPLDKGGRDQRVEEALHQAYTSGYVYGSHSSEEGKSQ